MKGLFDALLLGMTFGDGELRLVNIYVFEIKLIQ